MKPKSRKSKGRVGEQECLHAFELAGWEGRLQPGSGIYSAFPHDVQVTSPTGGLELNIEVKRRKGAKSNPDDGPNAPKLFWATGERWIGQADVLWCRADHSTPWAYMPAKTFEEMLRYIAQLETELKKKDAA